MRTPPLLMRDFSLKDVDILFCVVPGVAVGQEQNPVPTPNLCSCAFHCWFSCVSKIHSKTIPKTVNHSEIAKNQQEKNKFLVNFLHILLL